MRTRFLNFIHLIAVSVVFACAPPSNSPNESFRTHNVVGSLAQNLKEIQASTHLEACDQKNQDLQIEIAAALDDQADAIAKNPATETTTDPLQAATLVPFFGSNLLKIPLNAPDSATWAESKMSWGVVIAAYQKNKTSPPPHFWSSLNSRVHTLLDFDKKRIVDQLNLYLDKDSVTAVPSIQNLVDACAKQDDCVSITWPDSISPVIQSNPIYHQLQTKLDAAAGSTPKRAVIQQFKRRIDLDAIYRLNDVNHTVLQTESTDGKHVLQLPLDGSSFSDADRSTLKGFIESVWQTPQNQVEISWKNSSDDSDVFKLFFEKDVGSLSFTQFYQRQVHFFAYNNNRVIAHEMGHVLGLDDHYYILWNPDTCEYTLQTNNGDLMSNQNTGSVTAEEWAQLFEKYPASSLH
jgi:hypothetical protein